MPDFIHNLQRLVEAELKGYASLETRDLLSQPDVLPLWEETLLAIMRTCDAQEAKLVSWRVNFLNSITHLSGEAYDKRVAEYDRKYANRKRDLQYFYNRVIERLTEVQLMRRRQQASMEGPYLDVPPDVSSNPALLSQLEQAERQIIALRGSLATFNIKYQNVLSTQQQMVTSIQKWKTAAKLLSKFIGDYGSKLHYSASENDQQESLIFEEVIQQYRILLGRIKEE